MTSLGAQASLPACLSQLTSVTQARMPALPGLPLNALPTITKAIDDGAARLRLSGIDSERLTAGVLLGRVLAVDRTHLLTRSEEIVSDLDYEAYLRLIERRAAGEPIQYITGHQEFYGLDFIVSPDVLIPRPETEFLVERVIKLVEESRCRSPLIVEIGTGSGCIAVSLAVAIPEARLVATDVSSRALDIAQQNADKHRVADRIEFIEGNLFEPLRTIEGRADFIASNPPYVPAADFERLPREVRAHEPPVALLGGKDGLDFYRALLGDAARFLKKPGKLVIEIGFGQLAAIREVIQANHWELLEVTKDLQGIPRTLTIEPR